MVEQHPQKIDTPNPWAKWGRIMKLGERYNFLAIHVLEIFRTALAAEDSVEAYRESAHGCMRLELLARP